jgi:hypothetical protein
MTEDEKQTKFGWLKPIAGAVVVALLAGGTAPWWLQVFTDIFSGENFSLQGKWAGSPDCVVRFFFDDGKSVKGVCDKGVVSHSVTGTYLGKKTVTVTVVRRDENGCESKADGSIRFKDKDTVVFSQAGWIGCGIRTEPVEQIWVRNP